MRRSEIRDVMINSPLFTGLLLILSIALAAQLFEKLLRRAPGNDLIFPKDFSGTYCIVVNPKLPESTQNNEGYLTYYFDGKGISKSSTFPRGKGSTSRAYTMEQTEPSQIKTLLEESGCGAWSFGDTTIIMGNIGASQCRKISDLNATVTQALDTQCGK